MSYVNPIWLEGQRQRWTRLDAHRFMKPEPIPRKSHAERLVEQSKAEEGQAVLAARQDEPRDAIERLRWLVKDLKIDLAIRRLKYRPDQARDELGRWTDEGGSSTDNEHAISNEEADSGVDKLNASTSVTISRGAESVNPSVGDSDDDVAAVHLATRRTWVQIDYSRVLTGTPEIDRATKNLSEVLQKTMEDMEIVAQWSPQQYGTAVHVAFGTKVRFGGMEGIGLRDVEHSFVDGRSADYGEKGSIRTDVVLRNIHGEVIAIYDVKTGNAEITTARAVQLRTKAGVGLNVPIIQIHIIHGLDLKTYQ